MPSSRFSLLVLAASFTVLGCHAQAPIPAGPGVTVPPALARRVEVLLRQKAQLPPGAVINLSTESVAEIPGYHAISVTFSADGKTSHPVAFLISDDGKTLAQFTKYDISADPRTLISADNRPFRGGPATAPVLIVGFDDLECPFCARLNAEVFPALTARYGDKVHFVYKDFPLDQHPWALHAAIDVNCLGEQSSTGYWNLVDFIHANASNIGADPKDAKADKTLPHAEEQLDELTREQGRSQKADLTVLNACLAKKDVTAINASRALAIKLGVDSTPSLFINGDKIDGALPLEFLYKIIDDALRAEGVVPPPPYVAPVTKAPDATTAPAATPARPGA